MTGFFFWTAIGAACATVYYNVTHRSSSSGRIGGSGRTSDKIGSTSVGSERPLSGV